MPVPMCRRRAAAASLLLAAAVLTAVRVRAPAARLVRRARPRRRRAARRTVRRHGGLVLGRAVAAPRGRPARLRRVGGRLSGTARPAHVLTLRDVTCSCATTARLQPLAGRQRHRHRPAAVRRSVCRHDAGHGRHRRQRHRPGRAGPQLRRRPPGAVRQVVLAAKNTAGGSDVYGQRIPAFAGTYGTVIDRDPTAGPEGAHRPGRLPDGDPSRRLLPRRAAARPGRHLHPEASRRTQRRHGAAVGGAQRDLRRHPAVHDRPRLVRTAVASAGSRGSYPRPTPSRCTRTCSRCGTPPTWPTNWILSHSGDISARFAGEAPTLPVPTPSSAGGLPCACPALLLVGRCRGGDLGPRRDRASQAVPTTYYLALGDSLSVGYQPGLGRHHQGYSDDLYSNAPVRASGTPACNWSSSAAAARRPATMINGGKCDDGRYPTGLAARRRGSVPASARARSST